MLHCIYRQANLSNVWWLICVMSYYRVFGAKWRHAKTRKMLTFSCFRMVTPRPATRKYDTFHASPFRLLFVASLPGNWRVVAWRLFAPPGKDTTNRGENAKGRHAKTRQMMIFLCFRMATFRPATRKYATFHALRCFCLSYLCLARRKVAMQKPDKITFILGEVVNFIFSYLQCKFQKLMLIHWQGLMKK